MDSARVDSSCLPAANPYSEVLSVSLLEQIKRTFLAQWVILLLLLLILGGFGANNLYEQRQSDLSLAQERLSLGAKSLALHVENHLISIDAALLDLLKNLPYLRAEGESHAFFSMYLQTLQKVVDGIRTVGVFNAKGITLASSRNELVGKDFSQREFFQAELSTTGRQVLHVSEPFKTSLGAYSLNLTRSTFDAAGKFSGIVTATLDPEDFKPILEGMRYIPDVSAGLIHGSGKVLFYASSPEVAPGTDVSDPLSFFSKHVNSGKAFSELAGFAPVLQGERIAAVQTINPATLRMNAPLVIVVSQEIDSILANWHTNLRNQSILFALLVASAVASLLYAQRRQRNLVRIKLQHQLKQEALNQSLRESKTFVTEILDSLVQHIAVLDAQGTILSVNQAWQEFANTNGATGQTLTSVGLNYLDICSTATAFSHGTEAPAVMAGIRDILAGVRLEFSLEYPCHSPDEERWFVMHVSPLRGVSTGAVVAHENITLRKQAERSLDRSLRVNQQFLDHLPGIAFVKDSNLRVLMANKAFQALLGMTPDEIVGKTNTELFPSHFAEKLDADDRKILASGQSTVIEEDFDGRYFETNKFTIESADGARLLGGITMDITQRQKHIERQQALLRISELGGTLPEKDFLQQGLEIAERLTGSQIGFIHFVNEDQESIEFVTWTHGALKGCSAVHENHYPIRAAGIWADCARTKTASIFNDYPNYCAKKGLPEGHAPLQRLVSVPVVEEGKVRLILGVGNKLVDYDDNDCTTLRLIGNDLWRIVRRMRVEKTLKTRLDELTALNARLDETNNKLLQSEKLASIGQLAAGVAHEINNPIGYVSSNLHTLTGYVNDLLAIDTAYGEVEERYGTSSPHPFQRVQQLKSQTDHAFLISDIHHLLSESSEGLERVRKIVGDLKDFSRPGEAEWQRVSLHKGLESTLNIVWNEIKYKAEVDREYGDLPDVFCIPSQINQVFMNLLTNAAQAIETHGHIVLRSGHNASTVWFEVQDDGAGIAPENQKAIFEPFYTTKPVGKGTGLGLSLSWSIIQRHNGTIAVCSEPGKGTTFRITLPIDQPDNTPQPVEIVP